MADKAKEVSTSRTQLSLFRPECESCANMDLPSIKPREQGKVLFLKDFQVKKNTAQDSKILSRILTHAKNLSW